MVWDSYGGVSEIINEMSSGQRMRSDGFKEVPLHAHGVAYNKTEDIVVISDDYTDMTQNEDPKGPRFQKLTKRIFQKKPKAKVLSFDWSKLVSRVGFSFKYDYRQIPFGSKASLPLFFPSRNTHTLSFFSLITQ